MSQDAFLGVHLALGLLPRLAAHSYSFPHRGWLVLVTEIDSDVTVSTELILLLNSDYSQLTDDFCRKAPTSDPRKCLFTGSSYMRVSWRKRNIAG